MDSGIINVKRHQTKESRRFIIIGIIFFTLFVVFLIGDKNSLFTTSRKRAKRGQADVKCENGGSWNEKSRSCACKFGWIGNQCGVWHNHSCYFDNGTNYRGLLSTTTSGHTCKYWTSDHNSRFDIGKLGIGVHNYCRNPDNDKKGLWCYVGGDAFIGYCNATQCSDDVRKLLLLNASEIISEDDTSAAVKFLFGPLISGVCAGVVALLGFIAIAEYARRRRYSMKKRKKVENADKSSNLEKQKEINKVEDKIKSKDKVRKLGDIITVDVDTGKEKIQTFSSKERNAVREILEKNDFGESNDAFIYEDPYNTSPPPPYKPRDEISSSINIGQENILSEQPVSDDDIYADEIAYEQYSCNEDHNHKYSNTAKHERRNKRKGKKVHSIVNSSQSAVDDFAAMNEASPSLEYERETMPYHKTRDSKGKGLDRTEERFDKNSQMRKKQRRKVTNNQSSPESSQNVIEEYAVANKTLTKRQAEQSDEKSFQFIEENKYAQKKIRRHRRRDTHSSPESSQSVIEESTVANESTTNLSNQKREPKRNRETDKVENKKEVENSQKGREKQHSNKRSKSISPNAKEDESQYRRAHRPKRNQTPNKRKSVKDLTTKFENHDIAENDADDEDKTYERVVKSTTHKNKTRKNNVKPYIDTKINSRLEPTTFV